MQGMMNEVLSSKTGDYLTKENVIQGPNNTLILHTLGNNVQNVVSKIHDMYRSETLKSDMVPTDNQSQPELEKNDTFKLYDDMNTYEADSSI